LLRGASCSIAAAAAASVQASRSLFASTNRTTAVLLLLLLLLGRPDTKSMASPTPWRSFATVMFLNMTLQVGHSCTAAATKSRSSTVSKPWAPVMVMFLQAGQKHAIVQLL
jgi:hypothetical protein